MQNHDSRMETNLAKHVIDLCDRFYGLTKNKAQDLAYEFATKNSLDIPFRWKNEKKAGKNHLEFL